ncbi:MAG: 3-deoxy-D-manno-octulosonic acid transferase [Candidatus Omnitrophica bacterium]|nr:3-deoxy-D-manno-octulosonic acid transferase [Candidatus Omnitrophota bacterium]
MTILFDIFFAVYILLYLPVLVFKGKWHDGFKARLGFIPQDMRRRLSEKKNIWLHAVSVGEVVAIEGLAKGLGSRYPDHQIVVSVTTKAGYALAEKKYKDGALVIWSPLDFSVTARAFVKCIQPVIYIAAETELWPNLFNVLSRKQVPGVIVNGRISDEAFGKYKMVRWALKGLLANIKAFVMQSELDAQRIIALGACPNRVRMLGNVKFDNIPQVQSASPAGFGFEDGQKIFVAGSTHPGEEEIVLKAMEHLKTKFSDLRLVIAPRHPERARDVADIVRKRGMNPVFLSARRQALKATDVLVVDTVGQLVQLYSISTLVFVGKSLTVKGGHNIIEPALFAKPMIVGPYMENFRDIVQIFKADNALGMVQSADDFENEAARFLASADLRHDLGRRAQAVVEKNRGATGRTLKVIEEFLGR